MVSKSYVVNYPDIFDDDGKCVKDSAKMQNSDKAPNSDQMTRIDRYILDMVSVRRETQERTTRIIKDFLARSSRGTRSNSEHKLTVFTYRVRASRVF